MCSACVHLFNSYNIPTKVVYHFPHFIESKLRHRKVRELACDCVTSELCSLVFSSGCLDLEAVVLITVLCFLSLPPPNKILYLNWAEVGSDNSWCCKASQMILVYSQAENPWSGT